MSGKKHKKINRRKEDQSPTSLISILTAVINLIIAIINLIAITKMN